MQADHEFMKLIYKGNISELYKYLRSSNTHPYEIKDYRGYTALHIAALNNNSNLVRFLIRYIKDIYSNSSDKILGSWVS
jgi:ankyrin repeat protein